MSARAAALVREQLKHGPRSEASIMAAAEAAEISEHVLIAAASVLGVRTQKGRWWLPDARQLSGQAGHNGPP
jgi:transposase